MGLVWFLSAESILSCHQQKKNSIHDLTYTIPLLSSTLVILQILGVSHQVWVSISPCGEQLHSPMVHCNVTETWPWWLTPKICKKSCVDDKSDIVCGMIFIIHSLEEEKIFSFPQLKWHYLHTLSLHGFVFLHIVLASQYEYCINSSQIYCFCTFPKLSCFGKCVS